MTYVLDSANAVDVFIRRVEDGAIVGFNRPGLGEPSATETKWPEDIDKYFPQLATPPIESELSYLKAKIEALELDVAELKRAK